MDLNYDESGQKPVSGRVCVAIGIGFVAFLVAAIVGVLLISGG